MKLAVLRKVARVIGKHLPLPLVIVLFVFTLTGVSIPKDYELYKKVGFFVIRPYKYGLYLTQQNSKIFYNVSPYQFYYLNDSGDKENLLNWSEEIHSKETQLNKGQKVFYSLLSYLKLADPKATFKNDNKSLVLNSHIEENKILLKLSKNTFTQANSQPLYVTLSFNEKDIVFDDKNSVYSTITSEELKDINKNLKTALKISEASFSNETNVETIYILNPELNGYLYIPANTPNQVIEKIDLQNNLLEVRVTSYDTDTPTIEFFTKDTDQLLK